jgi:hypothetical protein
VCGARTGGQSLEVLGQVDKVCVVLGQVDKVCVVLEQVDKVLRC